MERRNIKDLYLGKLVIYTKRVMIRKNFRFPGNKLLQRITVNHESVN